MKKYLFILSFFSSFILFSQTKSKEEVYLLFDVKNNKKCFVEDGTGKSSSVKVYRKKFEKQRMVFYICDEEFGFSNKRVIDTLSSLENLNIRNIDYLKNEYQKSRNFKHHVFKKVFLLERISENEILKYDVYWCCEWSIE